jgi:hypothetical protein
VVKRPNRTEFNLSAVRSFHQRTDLTSGHLVREWRWAGLARLGLAVLRVFRTRAGYWHPLQLKRVAACFLLSAGCATAVDTPRSTRDLATAGSCARLDSQLYQLSQSTDPGRFASNAGLELNPSGARVVIKLLTGAQLPRGHGVTVEANYANVIQARVPVSELCALARDPAVISVALPDRGLLETGR